MTVSPMTDAMPANRAEEKSGAASLPAVGVRDVSARSFQAPDDAIYCWVRLMPREDWLQRGIDPAGILAAIGSYGSLVVTPVLGDAVSLELCNPAVLHVRWEGILCTSQAPGGLQAAFSWLFEDDALRVLPIGAPSVCPAPEVLLRAAATGSAHTVEELLRTSVEMLSASQSASLVATGGALISGTVPEQVSGLAPEPSHGLAHQPLECSQDESMPVDDCPAFARKEGHKVAALGSLEILPGLLQAIGDVRDRLAAIACPSTRPELAEMAQELSRLSMALEGCSLRLRRLSGY